MGMYLNPGSDRFKMALDSEIYVDKTEMIICLNSVINTNQRFVSVSRPRRFGKTMAADMVCAYYDCKSDSRGLFEKCKLSHGEDEGIVWDKYLGKFNVIRLVMTEFLNGGKDFLRSLDTIRNRLLDELEEAYPEVKYDPEDLFYSFDKFYRKSGKKFVIVIDEWDSVFREYKYDKDGQKLYLDFLRDWLKDREYVALAYMTGILPIKKYGKHSALNMFDEYSMLQPRQFAPYMGFTDEEVRKECAERGLNFEAFKIWYDGYRLSNKISSEMLNDAEKFDNDIYREYEIYSPYSVVSAMMSRQFANYWNQTETYEALQKYIDWDFEGLREEVAILMDGGRIKVDITGYQNDMTTFNTKDDILTMLIHLGYLCYDRENEEVFIPNKEVMQVFNSSTRSRDWTVIFRSLENSRKLLEATWNCNEELAAELIEAAHDKAGNRTYNSEEALSYSIQLAYYSAQEYYTVIPELDTGKGYADLVYLPKVPDKPALLIELKYDKDAKTAISQIHERKYPQRLEHYEGNMILVGINYDKTIKNDHADFKHHSCVIEKA
jgi:hypothetical protein